MLDTHICIYLMKHLPPQVRARFAECFGGDVVISAITLAELELGVACSGPSMARNQAALESLLDGRFRRGAHAGGPAARFGVGVCSPGELLQSLP